MPNMVIAKPPPSSFSRKDELIGRQALSDCEFDDGFMIHLRQFPQQVLVGGS